MPHGYRIFCTLSKDNSASSGNSLQQDLFREFRIFIACETSENLPVIVDCIGEDNLVIGSDYGHNDPFEQRNLLPTLKSLTNISERVVDKMVRDNPCALYAI